MAHLYDTIIIGAGHNGLTAAAYLARAGQSVLVLERREQVGGTLVTEVPWPGFHVDTAVHRGQLAAEVVQELELGRHGLHWLPALAPVFGPTPAGGAVLLSPDTAATREALRRFAPADADRWPEFRARLDRFAGVLRTAYHLTMPRLPEIPAGDLPPLARLLLHWRGLGKQEMMELLRLLPMSAAELLDEWFTGGPLKGVLGALGVHGLTQGPLSAGTAFLLLHHWINHGGPFKATARGGLGQITQALAAAARLHNAEVRLDAEVARILVKDGRATGVALTNGDEVAGRRVVSALDPRRTFLNLVDPLELEPDFVRAVQNIKMRGAWAKVNLALAGLPHFPSAPDPAALQGTLVISPSLAYLERAYDAAKYGGVSEQPYLEAVIPTLADPSLAPAGRHILSIHMQFAPYRLKTGHWDAGQREALGDLVVQTLAGYAPDLPGLILERQVLTPLDLERTFGLTEGNLYHGEMMLDQILFMRPVPGWAQYHTPIAGLYLCGPGAHPGGGVSGLPGRNAARQILRAPSPAHRP